VSLAKSVVSLPTDVTIAIVGSAYDGSLNGFGYREICFTAKALDQRAAPVAWAIQSTSCHRNWDNGFRCVLSA